MIWIVRNQLLDSRIRRAVEEVLDELGMMMSDLKAETELAKCHTAECHLVFGIDNDCLLDHLDVRTM